MALNGAYVAWATQCVDKSTVAALTFLVWDILTTIDDEVECIWRKPFAWSKALFVFIRYFALLFQMTILFVGTTMIAYPRLSCYSWYIFFSVTLQIFVSSVEIVLMLRVHALYSHNVYIKSGTTILFVIESAAMMTCLYETVHGLQFDDICIILKGPSEAIGYGTAAIGFELLLFVLTLAKFVQALRFGWGHTQVMQTIIWDGTWAFGIICSVLLVNSVAYFVVAGPLSSIGAPWLLSVEAFAGCRLLMNMLRLATPGGLRRGERDGDGEDGEDGEGEGGGLVDTYLDFVGSGIGEFEAATPTPTVVGRETYEMDRVSGCEAKPGSGSDEKRKWKSRGRGRGRGRSSDVDLSLEDGVRVSVRSVSASTVAVDSPELQPRGSQDGMAGGQRMLRLESLSGGYAHRAEDAQSRSLSLSLTLPPSRSLSPSPSLSPMPSPSLTLTPTSSPRSTDGLLRG